MSDLESFTEYDTAYQTSLENQIQLKKRLLQAAEKQLEQFRSLEQESSFKSTQIALTDTLTKIPFHPPRNDLVGLSLTEENLLAHIEGTAKSLESLKSANSSLQTRKDDMESTASVFAALKSQFQTRIHDELAKKQQLLDHQVDDSCRDPYEEKKARLEKRSKKLINISKKLIVDYVLRKEFEILFSEQELEDRKQTFLKLLEILLNNSIMTSGSSKLLEIDNKDDPLIRYLVINNIIVVDSKNPNKIKLRDLATNIY
ncbi:hypothetical protein OGAPHI_000837 [Ogataea philodendri]|uniref:Uncharacterized protein n=1 Tax=Ogataea philodendri TaxID=1378263 RepID=A0A9P8PFS9_9ASCO|nr:uncharacterized protein OGAPHI_000837 [Ogataea philodendri]KAH3671126.1 hypothetical protein OGAPHI_000837 [Ogataea philodendri]